jgi:hypothetical protein
MAPERIDPSGNPANYDVRKAKHSLPFCSYPENYSGSATRSHIFSFKVFTQKWKHF